MIYTLRRKLSLLLISVIATVILCTTTAALVVSERQFNSNEQERLDIQANQLVQDVRINGIIQAPQLSKFEVANNLIISILEEGKPIPFRGGWQPATDRDMLISYALDSVPAAAGNWNGIVMGDHGDRYLATIRQINEYRNMRTVVVLQDMKTADGRRFQQRRDYAGIALLALILMSFFCWKFTGWAAKPIKEAHERQNQFVSAASHDLRTPLQVMRTNTEALKLNPPNAAFFIEQILNEISHMSKLSDDLLVLTAAPHQKALEGSPVEIDDLIRNAIDYYSAAAKQKGIKLSLSVPAVSLPLLEGNEAMLQRALNTLIDNAICYTQPGGHIEIIIKITQKSVALIVEDDGPGIAPEHQAHIFEQFYRADQSRTDRAHSGLGLCIAKSIIENHRGQLIFDSREPRGSRFSIFLPRIGVKQCN